MKFEEINKQNAKQIKEWFSLYNSENRFIEFYKDTDRWLGLINKDSNRKGYVAILDDEIVGFIDLELDKTKQIAHISFGIAPEKRGQGLGVLMIKKVLKLAQDKHNTNIIFAGVEVDNTPSQKLLTKLGFRLINEEDDIKTYEFK